MKEKARSLLQLVKYAASSGACFLIDYGLFTLLNAVVLSGFAGGGRELIATYGARIVSAIVNFLLNRGLVFKSAENVSRSAVRYAILAVIQATVSALLVSLLQRLLGTSSLAETLIKVPVDILLFLFSYQVQKRWVFAGKKTEEKE